jgi:hypothetical protein
MTSTRTLLDAAVLNNAEWCHAVCRTHGLPSELGRAIWSCPTRTPPLYPDAVTLRPALEAEQVLDGIDIGPGCSVKDSFADLDLAAAGFRVLFDAEWITRDAAAPVGERLEVVRDPQELAEWERAWGDGDEPDGLFGADLIESADVELLARRRDGRIVAGAALNRSATVVGVSNWFFADDEDAAWEGAIATAAAHHPGVPLVGYAHGEALADALRHGFVTIGPLRVWLCAA